MTRLKGSCRIHDVYYETFFFGSVFIFQEVHAAVNILMLGVYENKEQLRRSIFHYLLGPGQADGHA